MGLLDSLGGVLKGAFGEAEAAALPAMINAVLAKTQYGDLNGLVSALQQGGLGPQVKSWLGNGANLPVSADQLRSALGDERVRQIAASLGIPVDVVLGQLSQHLPATIDKMSPNGTLEEQLGP